MKKILVVDNNPVILRSVGLFLENKGHTVLMANDGLTALEILKDSIPDTIFIDLVMPNIDGRKLCRIIRQISKLKNSDIYILSAIVREEKIDFKKLGAKGCIAKGPFSIMKENILSVVEQTGKDKKIESDNIIGIEEIYERDITKELLDEKKHLEVILESMDEGVMEITFDVKVVYANPSLLSIIGIPEEKLLGSAFLEFLDYETGSIIKEMLDILIAESKPVSSDKPFSFFKRQVEFRMLPFPGEEKAAIIIKDVTEEIRRALQLEHAKKMESVGTLAAGIAHDFNNLLMGIRGYASLIGLKEAGSKRYASPLKGIEKLVQSGSRLTAGLLGYSSKEKYKAGPEDINILIRQTCETFGRTRKQVHIHLKLDNSLNRADVEKVRIEQILFNLLINAADSMSEGGDIFLSTMNTSDYEIGKKVYIDKPGSYVQLTVRDTGAGMDKAVMERIFDPFFTTKEMGRGTGLGLASVYGIIKAYGGYIDVDSVIGSGTTFNIYFPASKEIKNKRHDKKTDEDKFMKGKETLLLVDDEEMIRDVGLQILETLGYRAFTAKNGREAVDIFKDNKEDISLILLDMVMPEMGGNRAFDLLKEIDRDVKIILLSGYSADGEVADLIKRGCDDFVQKPFNIKELSGKIRMLLDNNGPMGMVCSSGLPSTINCKPSTLNCF